MCTFLEGVLSLFLSEFVSFLHVERNETLMSFSASTPRKRWNRPNTLRVVKHSAPSLASHIVHFAEELQRADKVNNRKRGHARQQLKLTKGSSHRDCRGGHCNRTGDLS